MLHVNYTSGKHRFKRKIKIEVLSVSSMINQRENFKKSNIQQGDMNLKTVLTA